MHALRFLFSPSGRLRPQPFVFAAAGVYAAGVASHGLTTADVIARLGLWAFVAVQAVLVWIWFVLHAKRLRDAGRGAGLAAGVGLLYVLSIVLLVILAARVLQYCGRGRRRCEYRRRTRPDPAGGRRRRARRLGPL